MQRSQIPTTAVKMEGLQIDATDRKVFWASEQDSWRSVLLKKLNPQILKEAGPLRAGALLLEVLSCTNRCSDWYKLGDSFWLSLLFNFSRGILAFHPLWIKCSVSNWVQYCELFVLWILWVCKSDAVTLLTAEEMKEWVKWKILTDVMHRALWKQRVPMGWPLQCFLRELSQGNGISMKLFLGKKKIKLIVMSLQVNKTEKLAYRVCCIIYIVMC